MKVSINTSTFAEHDRSPLTKLERAKISFSLNPFKRTLQEEEIIELAHEAVGMIAGTEPLNARVLGRLPKLKVISRCGVGQDNVDLVYAKKKGIKVFTTPEGPTDAVAELTVGLILDLLRKISVMDRKLRAGGWDKQMGNLLRGKKVGIVGFGRIGQRVSQLLVPFGMQIGYYDIREIQEKISRRFADLPSLLAWADIVTIHAAWDNKKASIIGAEEIKKMKRGSWLVNVARGGAVDEEALLAALKNGYLSGAALDVFAQEPYVGSLRNFSQVVLTPHIGSYAAEARVQMELAAVDNLLRGFNLPQIGKNEEG